MLEPAPRPDCSPVNMNIPSMPPIMNMTAPSAFNMNMKVSMTSFIYAAFKYKCRKNFKFLPSRKTLQNLFVPFYPPILFCSSFFSPFFLFSRSFFHPLLLKSFVRGRVQLMSRNRLKGKKFVPHHNYILQSY